MQIRQFKTNDLNQINNIILALHPKWFNDDALKNIPIDSQVNNCLIAENNNKILGFIIYSCINKEAQINWFGVDINHHRQGIGKKLLNEMIVSTRPLGVLTIILETVVEQEPADGSYDETIKFYYSQGFELRKKYDPEESEGFVFSKGILEKKLI